jgi:hypothetical protein
VAVTDSGVVQAVVRKQGGIRGQGVTLRTAGAPDEQPVPPLLGLGQRVLLPAVVPPVETGIGRDQRGYIVGQCLRQRSHGEPIAREGFVESSKQALVVAQPAHDLPDRAVAHDPLVEQLAPDERIDSELATVPVQPLAVHGVEQGRGIASQGLALHPNGPRDRVLREALRGDMTRGAGKGVVR